MSLYSKIEVVVFIKLLLITAGLSSHRSLAQKNSIASPDQASATEMQETTTGKAEIVTDDSSQRFAIKEGDFSIVGPPGWEVIQDHANLSLLFQVPFTSDLLYQRTIQVAAFTGPVFIDEVTASEFEQTIVQKFSKASVTVRDYRIRNHLIIELADGRPGILFYSEFEFEGVALMQKHILVSSAERHYLMTFTDIAAHFDDERSNLYLGEAWQSMTSVELSGKSPSRFSLLYQLAGAGGFLMMMFSVVAWLRSSRAKRRHARYVQDMDLSKEGNDAFDREESTVAQQSSPNKLVESDIAITALKSTTKWRPWRRTKSDYDDGEFASAESDHVDMESRSAVSYLPARQVSTIYSAGEQILPKANVSPIVPPLVQQGSASRATVTKSAAPDSTSQGKMNYSDYGNLAADISFEDDEEEDQ